LLFFGKFRETYAYMIDFSTFFPNECTEGYTYLLITLATCSSFDVIIMIQFKNIFEFFCYFIFDQLIIYKCTG
jgi:hypothetical protein